MERLVRRPALFAGARLSRYGWGRKVFLVLAALVGSVAFAFAANLASRHALWQVVRACMLDKATTGAPLPCLEVDVANGEARGFAVLRVHFPRSYVDVNREPYELDPRMFVGRLPSFANTRSMRVAGGLGTIPRVVGDGQIGQVLRVLRLVEGDVASRDEHPFGPHDEVERPGQIA